jgi:hypothetical protein
MTITPVFTRRRTSAVEHPVELRFVDMLLIIIATLMFVAIVLSVVSAFNGSGQPDVAPQVVTRSAPTAIVGQPYELTLAVHGGDGKYTWQATVGAMPDGLRIRQDGIVEGTPTQPQATRIGVRVTDGSGRVSEVQVLTFTVRLAGTGSLQRVPPHIVGAVTLLDDAVVGQDYNHKFTADSGSPPHRWSISELPSGLEFVPDGTLAGRPAEAGTSTFTVTMADADGTTARQEIRLVVREQPESLLWRILGMLKTIITFLGYFLVGSAVLTLFIGAPAHDGAPGILDLIRNRKKRGR